MRPVIRGAPLLSSSFPNVAPVKEVKSLAPQGQLRLSGQSPPPVPSPPPVGMGRQAPGGGRPAPPTCPPDPPAQESALAAGSRPGASSLPRGQAERGGAGRDAALPVPLPSSLPPGRAEAPAPARPGSFTSGFISRGPASVFLTPPRPTWAFEFLAPSPLYGPSPSVTAWRGSPCLQTPHPSLSSVFSSDH